MQAVANPNRSRVFRLITIASSAMCSFIIGLWGLKLGFGDSIAGIPTDVIGSIVAPLCALAAGGAALSFFAGVDESVDYVFAETQVDKLTGLNARVAMIGKIAEAAVATVRSGEPVFLIDIDIDRFKHINDSIGYSQGDELIRAFSNRLRASLPENVVIGRIGAGEFAVLYPDGQAAKPMDRIVEELIEQLMQPYHLPTHQQSVNLSAGIVAMPKDGSDPVQLLRRSNLALQHARAGGIGNWSVFQPDMGQIADYRQWIESELHTAFVRGDFDLHYQPQLDLVRGKIIGYEALIRWRHPERGMIAPMEFIPIAEETGMILPIGEWVLRRACNDARHLPEDCLVAVNISPVQFMTRDFVGTVREVIQSTGIKPERLELEVTETAMMQDRERAAVILKQLSDMGISVAVDDFGTGYSNLTHLYKLDFEFVKVDQAFARHMFESGRAMAIVQAVVAMAHGIGADVVVEGVETREQLQRLRAMGVRFAQGYLVGQAQPAAKVLSGEAAQFAE